jgi:site-specific DNA-methyltransferase (adenine-specific)
MIDEFLNKVIQGDCLEVLKTLPEDSVDLIITSPPYAEQRKDTYGGIPEDEYPDWMLHVARAAMRVLKPTGSLVINIKEHVNNGVRSPYVLKTTLLLATEFYYVDEYIWEKTNPMPTGSKKRLKDGFERCLHFTKTLDYQFYPDALLTKSTSKYCGSNERRKNKGAFSTKNGSNMAMGRRITGAMVRPSNVFTFPTSCTSINHPAVFPPELPSRFMQLLTKNGDIVLDPFMGSGTTGVVCKQLGRHYIGIESKAEYVALANKRIGDAECDLENDELGTKIDVIEESSDETVVCPGDTELF